VNAVIAIGCLIKGETMHFEYISEAVSHGIMELGLKSGTVAPAGDAGRTGMAPLTRSPSGGGGGGGGGGVVGLRRLQGCRSSLAC